jgi:hypothetical protein
MVILVPILILLCIIALYLEYLRSTPTYMPPHTWECGRMFSL